MRRKISVLIPTYNAGEMIDSLLDKLYIQTINESYLLEIIVVDSSSSDNTIEIIKNKYKDVVIEVIPNKEFDHGGTRNYLASKATGDYYLFMTQDAIPYDNRTLEELLNPFEDEDVWISFARQLPRKEAGPLEVFARSFNYPDESVIKTKDRIKELGIKTFFNSNVCSMYRKEAFEKFGGFPENIILNEDMILSSQVILGGYKVSYTAEAKVIHSHDYSLKQQFKRYFDIGMAFKDTSYLLKHASNEKEGVKMVTEQLRYLTNEKYFSFLLLSLLESGAKFIGYKLGQQHEKIPVETKRKLSAYMK